MSDHRVERSFVVADGDEQDKCPNCGILRVNAGYWSATCGLGFRQPGCFITAEEVSEPPEGKVSPLAEPGTPEGCTDDLVNEKRLSAPRGSLTSSLLGRSPVDLPAHTSGCESPDPSPDCPRCAALTRERAAMLGALGEPCAECGHTDWRADPNEYLDRMEAAERDLAQARQALRGWYSIQLLAPVSRALDKASPNEVCDLRIFTREALVERGTEQDLGDDPRSSVVEVGDCG